MSVHRSRSLSTYTENRANTDREITSCGRRVAGQQAGWRQRGGPPRLRARPFSMRQPYAGCGSADVREFSMSVSYHLATPLQRDYSEV